MKVLFLSNPTSRIEKLIQKSHLSHYTIVCVDEEHAREVEEYAIVNGYTIPKPITFTAFKRRVKPVECTGFLIDRADKLLERIAGPELPVEAITMGPQDDEE
jgi:hypothetical protein